MPPLTIISDDGKGGNVEHIAQHGLTPAELDHVLLDAGSTFDRSRRSGLPTAFGTTHTGRYIMVAFEELDPDTVYPVTAYEVPEPKA